MKIIKKDTIHTYMPSQSVLTFSASSMSTSMSIFEGNGPMSAVPLFRCEWAVKGNGVKIEDGFTLVNMNHSQASFTSDPYIMASQAKQVFYSRENETSNWYIVMRGPSRRYSKEDIQEGNAEIGPLPTNIDMEVDNDEAYEVRTDCEGIYV